MSRSYAIRLTPEGELVVNDVLVPGPEEIHRGDTEALLAWALDRAMGNHRESDEALALTLQDHRSPGYGEHDLTLAPGEEFPIEALRERAGMDLSPDFAEFQQYDDAMAEAQSAAARDAEETPRNGKIVFVEDVDSPEPDSEMSSGWGSLSDEPPRLATPFVEDVSDEPLAPETGVDAAPDPLTDEASVEPERSEGTEPEEPEVIVEEDAFSGERDAEPPARPHFIDAHADSEEAEPTVDEEGATPGEDAEGTDAEGTEVQEPEEGDTVDEDVADEPAAPGPAFGLRPRIEKEPDDSASVRPETTARSESEAAGKKTRATGKRRPKTPKTRQPASAPTQGKQPKPTRSERRDSAKGDQIDNIKKGIMEEREARAQAQGWTSRPPTIARPSRPEQVKKQSGPMPWYAWALLILLGLGGGAWVYYNEEQRDTYVAVCVDDRSMVRQESSDPCLDADSPAYNRWLYVARGEQVPAVGQSVGLEGEALRSALVHPEDETAAITYGFADDGGIVGE